MIKRRGIKRVNFSDYSQISKWLFGIGVFVVIALIWVFYFLSTQYLGKADANISGIVLYGEKPLIDVTVSIGSEEVVTDAKGVFDFSNISYGRQILKINKTGYLSLEKKIFVWRKNYNAGNIIVEKDTEKSARFSGRVFDGFSKKPVEGAVIEFGGSNAVSNNAGEFQFTDQEKANHILKISAIGYQDISEEISLSEEKNVAKDYFLSPYGKVSFVSSRDGKKNIYSIGYDGKGIKNYTASIKGDCWSGQFTADGKKIVFYSNLGDQVDNWGQKATDLYFINKDGNEPKKINRELIPEDNFKLSKEGDRVLFLGKDASTDKRELYIVGIGGKSEWIQLTDNDIIESNFDISPDGTKVVFGAFEEGERKIFIVDVAKREIKPFLSNQNREGIINFSPDSKSVLYTMESYDFETRVFLYNIASNKIKEIYKNIAGIKDMVWNTDGTKIAFIATRDDRNYLYSINSDGTNELKLLEETGNYEKLIWPPIEKVLIVKMQDGDGKIISVLDLTQRKIQKVSDISDDLVGWQKN